MSGRIICSRATVALVAPGSVFRYACSLCKARVVMAPTGQNFWAANPDLEILCWECFQSCGILGFQIGIAGDVADVLAEIDAAVPNTWRDRN